MKITDFGVAVVEGDQWLSKWVLEHRRLDVQSVYCYLFQKYIPVGGVVVDVGACLGDHTVSYSEMVGPDGCVHAFEPNPAACECLTHNMQSRLNVIVHIYALGAKTGWGEILKHNEKSEAYNLGATQIAMRNSGDVLISTLDRESDKWSRLDFIKIDAEGFEPDIIRGGIETIKRFHPVILVEVNRPILKKRGKKPSDILGPLIDLGYSVQPSEPHISMDSDTLDVLCLPKNIVT